MVIQGISYPSDFEAKKNMTEIGRRLDEKGYVIAAEGSMSVRVGPDSVWVTAGNTLKGALTQDNFIRVDMSGKQIPASKKNELPADLAAHLAVYVANPELRGIIHAYPAGAAVLAYSGKEVQPAGFTPSVKALGHIPLVREADAYSVAMAAADACKTDAGIITAGDGCYMWAESITEAFCKLQALDYYVKVCSMLGSECASKEGGASAPKPYSYAAQPSPQPNTYASQPAPQPYVRPAPAAASSPDYSEMSGINGLTPIIKPGEKLPPPNEKRAAAPTPSTNAVPAASADVTPAAPPAAPAPPPGQTSSLRSQAMAGVVRRSLGSMK